ncbi:MAG: acyltransferase family protein [Desulfotomaculaceae bacterium]|nr:acyltransferase family protein [Desulfotomaculaceae bacterium]
MPGLDGLRALAVIAVIAYHQDMPWAPGGLLGVCLFFVLSGYLITDILVAQWKPSAGLNLKEFWLSRARRLLPALFVMLTGVIIWISLFDPTRLSSLWDDVLAALFYANNWWQIFHNVSYFDSFGLPSPLGHLWSLAVEEQFYLVWPLLLGLGLRYITQRGRLAGLIAALAMASAAAMAIVYTPGLDPSRVYYGTDTRAFSLLIGAVLALIWPSRKMSDNLSPGGRMGLDAAGGAALLVVLWMIWQSNQYHSSLYYGGLLLFSVAAAVVVAVLAHPASRLGRIFGVQPLRFLGVCSYGIYLWHYPVIVLTSPAVNTGGPDIQLALGQTALSVSLAVFSWFFIEAPIRRGYWKEFLPGLLCQLKGWQKPLGIPGKGALTVFLSVLILAVSGCAMIGQTKQTNIEPGIAGALEQTKPVGTGLRESEVNSDGQNSGVAETILGNEENGTGEKLGAEETAMGEDKKDLFTDKSVTVIGDSVMINVGPELKKLSPDIVVDAELGRQMFQAPQVIENLKEQGVLGETVVIALGSNGSFTEGQFVDILNLLGRERRIVLVNTRVPKPWESVVNQILARAAAADPEIELVDWHGASSGHDDYFYPDGVHLNPAGIQAYAALVSGAFASYDF